MTVFLKCAKEQRKYSEIQKDRLNKTTWDRILERVEESASLGRSHAGFQDREMNQQIIINRKFFENLGYDITFKEYGAGSGKVIDEDGNTERWGYIEVNEYIYRSTPLRVRISW